jgi:hypothetical protein
MQALLAQRRFEARPGRHRHRARGATSSPSARGAAPSRRRPRHLRFRATVFISHSPCRPGNRWREAAAAGRHD